MATRIHVFDDIGAALFWGESALGCSEDARRTSEVLEARDARAPKEPILVELEVELEDEEPCPETLRSPVSEGVSSSVRRPRVA